LPQSAAANSLATLVVETERGPVNFSVEIADTPDKRALGLMHRKNMPTDEGMLFIYDREQVVQFWMRNTHIPLDLIFYADDGIVKYIHRDAVPFSLQAIGPEQPVRFVLEINAGLSDKLAIKVGDKIKNPAR
jgi:uncharacterized membrane protein (UPF0127 family)